MNTKTWFQNKLESLKDAFEYRLEVLILEITEKFSKRMIDKKINRSQLAKRLNITSPAVTKILNGNSNFTLKTLLSIADALELDLEIDFKEKNIVTTRKVELAGSDDAIDSAYSVLKFSRETGDALSSVPHQDIERVQVDVAV